MQATQTFLHIGIPKTATTSIQNWLSTNVDVLRKIGVYTFKDQIFGHRLAVEAISRQQRIGRKDVQLIKRCNISNVLENLSVARNDPVTQNIIISSEYFCDADPIGVRSLLQSVGLADVKVVLILRRQDRYIESIYCEEVKSGRTKGIPTEARYWPHFDWWLLALNWADVFSREGIRVLLYDDLVKGNTSVIGQVLECFGPSLTAKLPQGGPDERANASWPAELVEIQRIANRLRVDITALVDKARQNGWGGPTFRLSPAEARSWLDIYRDSNRKIAKEFGLKQNDLFDESDLDELGHGGKSKVRLSARAISRLVLLALSHYSLIRFR